MGEHDVQTEAEMQGLLIENGLAGGRVEAMGGNGGAEPAATMQSAAQQRRPIELQDIITWKSIGTTAVSNDGQWFA